jgi:hypothetical protein
VHGDLRTSNVLVADEEAGFKFFFIDNERNSLHRTIPIKLVKKNLVQLDMLRPGELSLSDRLRFMRHYLESYGRFQGSDARALIGAVHKRALERLAAKDRR